MEKKAKSEQAAQVKLADRRRKFSVHLCICIYMCVRVCMHVYAYEYKYEYEYACAYIHSRNAYNINNNAR
jgi:hypothetical protein